MPPRPALQVASSDSTTIVVEPRRPMPIMPDCPCPPPCCLLLLLRVVATPRGEPGEGNPGGYSL